MILTPWKIIFRGFFYVLNSTCAHLFFENTHKKICWISLHFTHLPKISFKFNKFGGFSIALPILPKYTKVPSKGGFRFALPTYQNTKIPFKDYSFYLCYYSKIDLNIWGSNCLWNGITQVLLFCFGEKVFVLRAYLKTYLLDIKNKNNKNNRLS